MHEREVQAVLKKLTHIAENVSDPSAFGNGTRRSILMLPRNVPFCLVDDIADEYEDVQRQLLQRPEWQEKFSEHYIETAVRRVLGTLVTDGNTAQAEIEFRDLVSRLDTFAEVRVVFVPLDGVVTQVGRIEIGRVVLMSKEQAIISAENTISRQPGGDGEPPTARIQHWRQHVLPHLTAPTYAEYRTSAESDRATERAEEEARRVLDILRYYILTKDGKQHNIAVGLQCEVRYGTRETPVIRVDGPGFEHTSKLASPFPLLLSPQTLSELKQVGVFDLAALLKQDHLTEFEETLLRGIHWYANALTQVEPENELLSLTTCLETFLNPGSGEPVTSAIAEGVARLLGKDLGERKYLKRRVKEFYSKGSAVSHGGRKSILDKDLAELRTIAGDVTNQMVRRKDEFRATGKKGLLEWLEDQKFA